MTYNIFKNQRIVHKIKNKNEKCRFLKLAIKTDKIYKPFQKPKKKKTENKTTLKFLLVLNQAVFHIL